MAPSYQQATAAHLGRPRIVSAPAQALLEEREQALGIRCPASARDWYSLGEAVALLAGYSTTDRPVLPGELGAVVHDGHGTGPQEPVAAGLATSQGTDSRSRCFSTPGVLSGPNGGETGSAGRLPRAPGRLALGGASRSRRAWG